MSTPSSHSDRAMRRLITVTGPDRPGLVAAVSKVLSEEGADIEDVSMTRLSGNFATMLLARGGDEDRLRTRLQEVAQGQRLGICIEPAVESGDEPDANAYVSAIGPNRIGIVATLSEILARHYANITEMTTRLLPRLEVPMYLVRIEAVIPGESEALASDLQAAADQLGIELRFEPLERTDF